MSALTGKRCLITGASGGLGLELARGFGGSGCRLILSGRNLEALREVTGQLGEGTEVCDVIGADLRSPEETRELVEHVEQRFGGVDVLVNNAGVFPIGGLDALVDAELDECLAVNLRGPAILCRAFAPGMAERGWGRIVNIASSSAYAGFANTAIYCATKHGLLGLSRALDDELRRHGVRVIAVSPGSIKTPMGRKVEGQTFDTFMDPAEVAQMTVQVAALDGSMIVNELRLGRMVMG